MKRSPLQRTLGCALVTAAALAALPAMAQQSKTGSARAV